MSYRKRPGHLGMVFAALASLAALMALVACGANDSRAGKVDGATQSIALRRRLAEIAGQANQAAPADVDSNTRLDGARAGPGLRLTTQYTLVNSESEGINTTTFGAKLSPVIKKAGCTNTELRPLIDQGVVVVLEYRDSDGKPIGTISINRDTCGAPN